MNSAESYNNLVRYYYRSRKKLGRLIRAGKNLRKQNILKKRIIRLLEILKCYRQSFKRAGAIGAVAGAVMLVQPGAAHAQITFEGVSDNPLAFSNVGGFSTPAFADLDNDGDMDLMAGDSKGHFSYFQNSGTVTDPVFGAGVTDPFGLTASGYNSFLTFADLDNDGDLDILEAENTGNFHYFQNTGTNVAPAFAAGVTNPFGLVAGATYSTPAFADLDHDGDLDLLAGNYDGGFYYFENTGNNIAPAFAAPVIDPFGLSVVGYTSAPAFADIDSDGDLDLMVGEYLGNINYFQNTGTNVAPSFAPPVTDPFGIVVSKFNAAPSFVDIDNDGDLDLFSGDESGHFIYNKNTGSGSLPSFVNVPMGPYNLVSPSIFNAPAVADLDNDGDFDVLSGGYQGNFFYYQNTGSNISPSFANSVSNPFGLNAIGYISTPAFADLDNDGDYDMLSGSYDGGFRYFENTGSVSSPAFATVAANPFGLASVGYFSAPAFADLDADGDLDMMSGEAYGHFRYFQNTGTSTSPAFTGGITDPFGLTALSYSSAPTFADLDQDGDLDLISGDEDGGFFYFENTGTNVFPAFALQVTNPFGLADIGSFSAPAFADMDNDGDLDLISGEDAGHFFYFKNTSLIISVPEYIRFDKIQANVFPNPAHDKLQLNITSATSGTYNLSLLDLTGRKIFSDVLNVSNENLLVSYPVTGIERGMYLLVIESDKNQSMTLRVCVQ